jgi:imidazolonepropionase-like amidohydrolase
MTGEVRDVLVVDGDPTRDVRVLRDKARIVMIVQDGRIMKDRVQEASCRTTR